MKSNKIKIIISGGGTGGHIFPAIAIANALKRRFNDAEILFIGAKGKMEMDKVPAAGYSIKGLWISGFQRKLTLRNLSFPFKIISSLWCARKIITDFKPHVVVGVGGYASGPALRIATKKRIPTLIQEQNSFPGITNRLLAKQVDKICVAYDGLEKFFPKEKIVMTGNPVRQDIQSSNDKKTEGLDHFKCTKDKKTILVIGGSLGARTINESIMSGLKQLKDGGIQLIWQTGKFFYETAKQEIEKNKYEFVKVFDFINRMDLAYSVADVVISRAGAISISELCITGNASVFIPSPNVAEDHQTKNAKALANKDAAILVKDNEARSKLIPIVTELINNQTKIDNLKHNISKLAIVNSADIIADEVIKLIKT